MQNIPEHLLTFGTLDAVAAAMTIKTVSDRHVPRDPDAAVLWDICKERGINRIAPVDTLWSMPADVHAFMVRVAVGETPGASPEMREAVSLWLSQGIEVQAPNEHKPQWYADRYLYRMVCAPAQRMKSHGAIRHMRVARLLISLSDQSKKNLHGSRLPAHP